MQTQNYVYYMHFLVLKESEQKCARAFCEPVRMSNISFDPRNEFFVPNNL